MRYYWYDVNNKKCNSRFFSFHKEQLLSLLTWSAHCAQRFAAGHSPKGFQRGGKRSASVVVRWVRGVSQDHVLGMMMMMMMMMIKYPSICCSTPSELSMNHEVARPCCFTKAANYFSTKWQNRDCFFFTMMICQWLNVCSMCTSATFPCTYTFSIFLSWPCCMLEAVRRIKGQQHCWEIYTKKSRNYPPGN